MSHSPFGCSYTPLGSTPQRLRTTDLAFANFLSHSFILSSFMLLTLPLLLPLFFQCCDSVQNRPIQLLEQVNSSSFKSLTNLSATLAHHCCLNYLSKTLSRWTRIGFCTYFILDLHSSYTLTIFPYGTHGWNN